MKKVNYNIDIQRIISNICQNYTPVVHDLKTNFDKFFNISESFFKNLLYESNKFFLYSNRQNFHPVRHSGMISRILSVLQKKYI